MNLSPPGPQRGQDWRDAVQRLTLEGRPATPPRPSPSRVAPPPAPAPAPAAATAPAPAAALPRVDSLERLLAEAPR